MSSYWINGETLDFRALCADALVQARDCTLPPQTSEFSLTLIHSYSLTHSLTLTHTHTHTHSDMQQKNKIGHVQNGERNRESVGRHVTFSVVPRFSLGLEIAVSLWKWQVSWLINILPTNRMSAMAWCFHSTPRWTALGQNNCPIISIGVSKIKHHHKFQKVLFISFYIWKKKYERLCKSLA